MAKQAIPENAVRMLEACLNELIQQLEEVYAVASAGEVLLSEDKGPAFHLFKTVQRLTEGRKLTSCMQEQIKHLEVSHERAPPDQASDATF